MSWEVRFTSTAEKRIVKIPEPDKRRILLSIARLHEGPVGDIKPLKGRDEWRLRVGRWRVLLSIDMFAQVILVKYVDVRGDVYKS